MQYKQALSILFLVFLHTWSIAQIRIEFPVERIVFQRNNTNLGYVNVYGNVSQDCDRVEGRLVARVSGQGVTTPWTVIDDKVDGQAFSGKIQNQGGWYRLEVRGIKNETTLFSSSVERVGIGEVFLIAGQSNAQGYGTSPNARSASDDRVNAYLPGYHDTHGTDQYRNLPQDYLSDLSFGKVEAGRGIGPTGYTAYCYGELGDMLVNRLNVPVLFFNAAFSGSSTRNWIQSAQGIRTFNEHPLFSTVELLDGAPYRAFKITLQSINTLTGFRSVLWHQGEYDRFVNGVGLSAPEYFNNLAMVIQKSRTDIGATIPWVVARASYLNDPRTGGLRGVDERVIDGQNMVINSVPQVWAGPQTDGIQVPRYDGGHFQNVTGSMGLTQLATAWNGALTDGFFSQSNPVLPKDILKLGHYCIENGTVMVGPANFYNRYFWSDASGNIVSNEREIISGSGSYSLTVRDNVGSIYRTNRINISDVFLKTVPVISTPEGLTGCEGKPLRLEVAPSKYNVQWSTGLVSNTLDVRDAGGYSARYRSEQNCYSSGSQSYTVNFIPPPAQPQLTFLNGGGYKCDGETVTVAITNVQGADILWSTGATTNQVMLKDNAQDYVTATLYSLPNCPSPASQPMNYRVYANPAEPVISYNGPFYLKAEPGNTGMGFDWQVDGTGIEGAEGSIIPVGQPGTYQVRGIQAYTTPGGMLTCISGLSPQFVVEENKNLAGFSVYPNPGSTGWIQVTSNGERQNVDLLVIDPMGREVYKTHFDRISYPEVVDLSSRKLEGRYFVVLKYEAQSKAFPMLFVK